MVKRNDDPIMAQKAAIDKQIAWEEGPEERPLELAPEPNSPTPTVAEVEAILDSSDDDIANVIANMQREITQLKSTQDRTQRDQDAIAEQSAGGFPWQYYKRPKDGGPASEWITAGPGGAVPSGPRRGRHDTGARQTYSGKGFKVLTSYGVAPIPSDEDARTYTLFGEMLRNGGAKEFPVAQILAYKWHINPPITGLSFPAYEKVKDNVQTFECDDCERTDYFLPEQHEVIRSCFMHLRKQHDYPRAEARLALDAQGIRYRGARFALEGAKQNIGLQSQGGRVPEGFEEYASSMKVAVD